MCTALIKFVLVCNLKQFSFNYFFNATNCQVKNFDKFVNNLKLN